MRSLVVPLLAIGLLTSGASGAARGVQAAALTDRATEVVSVEGAQLPAQFRIAIDRLSLLRWRNGVVEAVPFQVDERDASGNFALPEGPAATQDEEPGIFDDNDVLVFAAGDVGENASSAGTAEIRVTDALNGAQGWVYIARCAEHPFPAASKWRDDVRYEAATDSIHARRYALRWGQHAQSFFSFASDAGPGPNLLDSLKARVTAHILWGFFEFSRNEDDLTITHLAWKDGPLRVIRRSQIAVRLGFGLPEPTIIAEDYFTADAFEAPVVVRLPFDLRYVFGDLNVKIFLDFDNLEGYQVFTAGHTPAPIACGNPQHDLDGVNADWFGMTGPHGTFLHVMQFSPTMQGIRRQLYVVADGTDDPPETTPGNCPGVGYMLTHWGGMGRGTHQIGMRIRALEDFVPGDEETALAQLQHPLAVQVTRTDAARGAPVDATTAAARRLP